MLSEVEALKITKFIFMVNAKTANKKNHYCHDCQKEIKIGEDLTIKNGVELLYEENGEKIKVFKCKECFAANPSLINYRQCEVYSRVVGYLRPVQQWNLGKKQEFKERKEFKLKFK